MEPLNTIQKIWLEHPDVYSEFKNFLRTMPTSHLPEVAEKLIDIIEKETRGAYVPDWNLIMKLGAFREKEVLLNAENKKRFINSIENREKNRVNAILSAIPDGCHLQRIMDFGCNDGKIIIELGKSLKIQENDLIGIDIVQPPNTEGFCFPFLDYLDIETFQKVDLVICLMVFHHITDPQTTLTIIRKFMKPCSYLILREHDNKQPILKDYFDLLHELWSKVFFPGEKEENAADYLPIEQWDKMFLDCGFILTYKIPHLSVNFSEYRLYRVQDI
jgi:SAM-dependent methyltransferase